LISPPADGTLVMTVGSLLPVAPSAAWLQHLRPPSDDPRHKPSGYLTDRTGVGRFMLTYAPLGILTRSWLTLRTSRRAAARGRIRALAGRAGLQSARLARDYSSPA